MRATARTIPPGKITSLKPILSAKELESLGFRLVIFPGGIVRAVARTAQAFYRVLARDGTTDAFRRNMFDFGELNTVLGTKAILERGRAYEGADAAAEAEKRAKAQG